MACEETMSYHAERNGPFIFWCLEKMWGKIDSYSVRTEEEIKQTPNNRSGLYIFYLEAGHTCYPIYVGITGRNFRQRFNEHYANGVISKLHKGEFPQNQPPIRFPLKVAVVPIQFMMQSKLMESVFLSAFDFCLNSEENGQVPLQIDLDDQFKPEDSKQGFDTAFENVMKEIQDVVTHYQQK